MNRREFIGAASSLAPGAGAASAGPANESIANARKAALEVLEASDKDLQHGLELHAASIVVEPYGFAPRAAIDGAMVARAVEDGAPDELPLKTR